MIYAVSPWLLVDAGATPWDARAYQNMSPGQRMRWLRSHPYTAARVDPVGLDTGERRRRGIVARITQLDTSQDSP